MNLRLKTTKLYLCGFMGSGKSTIGRLLAKRLRWSFEDTDKAIEKCSQMSVSEIFNTKGEAYFRRLETNILKKKLNRKKWVIALGGGSLLKKSNQKIIQGHGTLIYLSANDQTIQLRLKKNKTSRPLFKGQSRDEYLKKIKILMKERKMAYSKADFKVNTDGRLPKEIVNIVLEKISI